MSCSACLARPWGKKDLTGKSSSRKRFHGSPARPFKTASPVELCREEVGGVGWEGTLSPELGPWILSGNTMAESYLEFIICSKKFHALSLIS